MKITYKFFLSTLALTLSFLGYTSSNIVLAQETSATDASRASKKSKSKSKSRRRATTTNTNAEYTKEDCATKYIAALDRECYNTNTTNDGGVYADCSDKTMTDLYDIMDMQLSSIVGVDKLNTYKKKCDGYKGYALTKWLDAKQTVETSAIKGSFECVHAFKKLSAAKKCSAAALAHNGNAFEFAELMKVSCGDQPDVAEKFAKAGDIGLSNVAEMLDNYSTLQFTNKSTNWRQAVESVLAGYMYDAKQKCGEEDYAIIEQNYFTEDKRDNIIKKTKESFAIAAAENLGNRTANAIMYNTYAANPNNNNKASMGTGAVVATSVANGISAGIINSKLNPGIHPVSAPIPPVGVVVAPVVAPVGPIPPIGPGPHKIKSQNAFGNTTPQLSNALYLNNVYVIDGVYNVNNTRARLINILNSGDVGSLDNQDNIDVAIIKALGGRAGTVDGDLYNTLENLTEGDTFIIRQADLKYCQVLSIDAYGNLNPLTETEIRTNEYLPTYIHGCFRIVE